MKKGWTLLAGAMLAVVLTAGVAYAAVSNTNVNGGTLVNATTDVWADSTQTNANGAEAEAMGTYAAGGTYLNGNGAKASIDPLMHGNTFTGGIQ